MIISSKVFIIQIVFLCFWNKKKDSIQSSFASFEVWTIEINYYLPRSVSENKKGEGGGGGNPYLAWDQIFSSLFMLSMMTSIYKTISTIFLWLKVEKRSHLVLALLDFLLMSWSPYN